MKKKVFLIITLGLAAVIVAGWNSFLSEKSSRVCFKENCFKVEIAKTGAERDRGLMFRESLPAKNGMLFIFDHEGIYPFWMKNTLIPLDIIWMNKDKQVVYINKNTPPCITDTCLLFSPEKNALYVLELNADSTEKLGLKTGDYLSF